MNEATWEERCKQLIKLRNELQRENQKLINTISKITYLTKTWEQENIYDELRSFYLYLEKKKWVKPRNTSTVVRRYLKTKGDK